jgi:3',5'-cyclic AMP phosphodiesterase CpdA
MNHSKTRILCLSDLHIGRSPERSQGAIHLVQKILEAFGGQVVKPLLLFTGDITDDGNEGQCLQAQAILQPLRAAGFSLEFVPGNHDYGWNGNLASSTSYQLFQKHILQNPDLAYPRLVQVGRHFILLLDSMQAENHWYDALLADGELGDSQRKIFEKHLIFLQGLRSTGAKVLVALHHHPFLYPDESLVYHLKNVLGHELNDGEEFMNLVIGKIDALVFGHEHRHIHFGEHLRQFRIPEKYQIPLLLSCGSSSGIDDPNPMPGIAQGLHAWLIEIEEKGNGQITATPWGQE